jgi:hypothetical protein
LLNQREAFAKKLNSLNFTLLLDINILVTKVKSNFFIFYLSE